MGYVHSPVPRDADSIPTYLDRELTTIEKTISTTTDIATQYGAIPNRNIIHNGSMRVKQRPATSVTYTGLSSGYLIDRWNCGIVNTGGQITIDRTTLSNGVLAIRQTVDTAVTDITGTKYLHGFVQVFEGFDCYHLAGKNITISFWFASNVSGKYSLAIRNKDNSKSYITTFDYTSGSPQKITKTIKIEAAHWNASADHLAGGNILMGFLHNGTYATTSENTWLTGNYCTSTECVNYGSTNGNWIAVGEVQMEIGDNSTPFERVPLSQENIIARRYYQFYNTQLVSGISTSASQALYNNIVLPQQMRDTPSATYSNITYNSATSLNTNYVTDKTLRVEIVTTAADNCWGIYNVELSAEI